VRNNILANEQFGFYDNGSTDSAIFKLNESIFSVWNNKEYIIGLFCDLTKVFGSVSHELFDFEVGILWSKRLYIEMVKMLLA
jgi:hypothetical protein